MKLYHGGVHGLQVGDVVVPSSPHVEDGCPICTARTEGRVFTAREARAWALSMGERGRPMLAALRDAPDDAAVDAPTGKRAVYLTSSIEYATWYAGAEPRGPVSSGAGRAHGAVHRGQLSDVDRRGGAGYRGYSSTGGSRSSRAARPRSALAKGRPPPGSQDRMMITFTLPLRTVNPTNAREHHRVRSGRTKIERRTTWAAWLAERQRVGGHERATVTLTRIGPQPLDGDGLQAALKSVRDALAALLIRGEIPAGNRVGREDSDPRIAWEYGQEKGKRHEVRVEISVSPVPANMEATR